MLIIGWLKCVGWKVVKVYEGTEEGVVVIHSTWEDNSYLDKDYINVIKGLIHQSDNFYRIYALGEWGLLQRRIYTNYTIIPALPDMTGVKWD